MTRKILVLGNCQVAGVAAALQRIYWADEVQAVSLNTVERNQLLFQRLSEADIVFGGKPIQALLTECRVAPRQFVSLPAIHFGAFHPDMVAARGAVNGRFAYNSAICIWAYNKGISRDQTLRLFTRRTFAELGYFDFWRASVARLRSAFDIAGVEFERFYLAAKRLGTFMHTVNHPTAALLCYLAKTMAISAGFDRSVWYRDILINDALGRVTSWGVYPEIARELAVPGAYGWLVERGKLIEGLDNYVDYAFRRYAEAGVERGTLQMIGPRQETYDTVLSSALQRS